MFIITVFSTNLETRPQALTIIARARLPTNPIQPYTSPARPHRPTQRTRPSHPAPACPRLKIKRLKPPLRLTSIFSYVNPCKVASVKDLRLATPPPFGFPKIPRPSLRGFIDSGIPKPPKKSNPFHPNHHFQAL